MGHNSGTESNRNCMRHIILKLYTFLESFMKTSQEVTVFCGVQNFLRKKKNRKKYQDGITLKLNIGETIILQATHRLYLRHFPIKFHEAIPNDYQKMGCTRTKIKTKISKQKTIIKGHNSDAKNRKQP